MTDFEKMLAILRREEGEWPKGQYAYPDPESQTDTWAFGYGHQITDEVICAALAAGGTLTCNAALAEAMLKAQAMESLDDVGTAFPGLHTSPSLSVRRVALALARYQIGPKFLTWPDTQAAIRIRAWPAASAAMRDSDWRRDQTPARAERVCQMTKTGQWPDWIKELEAKEEKP